MLHFTHLKLRPDQDKTLQGFDYVRKFQYRLIQQEIPYLVPLLKEQYKYIGFIFDLGSKAFHVKF